MLTEQNPPWAAKLGVPNCDAHQPVSAWLWSRPVKNASLRGSVARMRASQSVAVSSASSHSISLNSPDPRGPTRFKGLVSLAGEFWVMIPAEPLAQSTPLLMGCSGLPWIYRIWPFFRCTLMPQRQAHM